jgi:hypothetical protein
MKNILFVTSILLLIAFGANAQKTLNLLINYDPKFERYEVFAKPNFSQKNFIWGPSQVSLVLPSNVLVEKIQIRNVDGGTWEDNSVVIAPEANPNVSFHGISSGGDKVDLVEDYSSLLFYFMLPKSVSPTMVRLFDNQNDPNSNAKGMLGGDFRNTIVDISGEDIYAPLQLFQELKKVEEPSLIPAEFQASIYPNVVRSNFFSVSLDGITEKDGDVLMILTNLNGKEISRYKMVKTNIEKQKFTIPAVYNGNTLFARFITAKGTVTQRIISDN